MITRRFLNWILQCLNVYLSICWTRQTRRMQHRSHLGIGSRRYWCGHTNIHHLKRGTDARLGVIPQVRRQWQWLRSWCQHGPTRGTRICFKQIMGIMRSRPEMQLMERQPVEMSCNFSTSMRNWNPVAQCPQWSLLNRLSDRAKYWPVNACAEGMQIPGRKLLRPPEIDAAEYLNAGNHCPNFAPGKVKCEVKIKWKSMKNRRFMSFETRCCCAEIKSVRTYATVNARN